MAGEALIDQVRATALGRAARWVRMENLHLTIRFLGDTPPDLVPDVGLSPCSPPRPPWIRSASTVRGLPDGRHPTIWLGVDRGNDGLISIIDALEAPLDRLGWSRPISAPAART
ncbi:MAG: 2'-5' RNA ligase family protein [Chloroflexota bacterium]